jgi:hypothetical protein
MEPVQDEKNKSVVINYPQYCPACGSTKFYPCVPAMQQNAMQEGVVYFQCLDTTCERVFARKLVRSNEGNKLFFIAVPGYPPAVIMLGSEYPADSIIADLRYRLAKKFTAEGLTEEQPIVISPLEDLIDLGKTYMPLLKELEKYIEPVKPRIEVETPQQVLTSDNEPSFVKMLKLGRTMTDLGVKNYNEKTDPYTIKVKETPPTD